MSACDRYRYDLLGCEGYHRNCQDNMVEGLSELGVTPPFKVSGSWNIFMNIPVGEDRNSLEFRPTVCAPGDYIVLRAEMDCFVVFSSCPQDILPINGEGGQPPPRGALRGPRLTRGGRAGVRPRRRVRPRRPSASPEDRAAPLAKRARVLIEVVGVAPTPSPSVGLDRDAGR